MKNVLMLILVILGVSLGNDLKAQTNCDQSCIDWYLVIVDESGRQLSETFLYTTCDGMQTISSCPSAGGRTEIYLNEEQASCEEEWGLGVVFSHENNAMCGAYVKTIGRVTASGGGSWRARAKLSKYVGSQLIAGACETAFYDIEDRSFIAAANEPSVTANFIATVGFGIRITITDGSFVEGDGLLYFPTDEIRAYRSAEFRNPFCW